MSEAEEKQGDLNNALTKIPMWAQNSLIGGVIVIVFLIFFQPLSLQVTALLERLNGIEVKISDRLHGIENKTETILAISNEKVSRLELTISKLEHAAEEGKVRRSGLEAKIGKLEFIIEEMKVKLEKRAMGK